MRLLHQSGVAMFDALHAEFGITGLAGEVSAFLTDMPGAFAQADLVVCRSGAGSVSELAAAGKPAVLIPFPFAAGNHQLKNAEALTRAGAAELCLDREWTGQKFFDAVKHLHDDRDRLARMGESAAKLSRKGAAARAAEILIDSVSRNRNNS